MRRNVLGSASLVVLIALVAAACDDGTTETTEAATSATTAAPTTEAPADPLQVALLLTARPTDSTWDERGYGGLVALESDFGAETAFTENMTAPEMEGAFRDYASQGYDLVVGHSFGFGDAAMAAATDHPDTMFLVNAGAHEADNVASISLSEQEAYYLAGALAAEVSATGIIGFIAGQDFPSLILELNGYIDGAVSVNPDIDVRVGWVGGWADPVKAQELAVAMIDEGADVIHTSSGAGDAGVLKAAEDGNVWAIQGVSSCLEAIPDNCLSSADVVWEEAIPRWVELWQSGQAAGGIYQWGIADGAVDLGPIHSAVPQAVVDSIMSLRADIVDGALVVPPKFELEE